MLHVYTIIFQILVFTFYIIFFKLVFLRIIFLRINFLKINVVGSSGEGGEAKNEIGGIYGTRRGR